MKKQTILKRLVKAQPKRKPVHPVIGPSIEVWHETLSIDPSIQDLAVAIQDLYERVKKLEKKK